MSNRPEPDDVDFVVGGVEPDARKTIEAVRFIEDYKNRPDYHFEAEEAERILLTLGINARDNGMRDAKSLLDHWRRCVADLLNADSDEAQARSADQNRIGVSPTG